MPPSPPRAPRPAFATAPTPLLDRRHAAHLRASPARRPRVRSIPPAAAAAAAAARPVRACAAASTTAATAAPRTGADTAAPGTAGDAAEAAPDLPDVVEIEFGDGGADDAVFSLPASAGAPGGAGAAAQYVPLHVHSDFSLLDGASHLPDLVARAAELGVPALALTDHGVLYGAVALVKHCARAARPVKPIIGNEMYVVNVDTPYVPPPVAEDEADDGATGAVGERTKKKKKKKPAPRRYHLIVLAKNTVGYRNLVKLTTHAHLEGKVGPGMFARPCVNKALLYEHREGLIVSSGCLGGEVAQAILNDRPDVARKVAAWFRDAFGGDYYLEIQDHGSPEDRKVNREVVKIGRELAVPVICTNDSHFTSRLDAEAHDALICIQTGKVLSDRKRLRYAGNEYFKSVDEMRACFLDHLDSADVEEALTRTLEVAEKVEAYDLFGDTRIPDFPVPPCGRGGERPGAYVCGDHSSYLQHVSREGLDVRLRDRLASGLLQRGAASDAEVGAEYAARLRFELDMIDRMGFSSYFLVVWDYIRYARAEGIPVGPGRGSAAGSLVAFALRITDVDPIQYNLLFERFLNPERRSMPDIDTDFSVDGRERIIRYVTDKYGADRVAQIITFNRLTSKAVLKDVARVHEVPYAQADKLAKLIPVARGKPATLSRMLADDGPSPEFRQIVKRNPDWERWLEKARRIEGTNKTFGIHAAGVVISAEPLSNLVPLSRAKHGETITQYPMEDVEALGLLKMDFLGLKNLTVIETALGFINNKRRRLRADEGAGAGAPGAGDLDFSVDALPLDDGPTYELLATGELDGIFQLDASAGMRSIVRELRPSSLEDISAILALYRPGPLDAGLIPKFINRKHGREDIVYDHELLEPILRETYGVMVYQEQIMRIARDLAGYSLGQADILRRAMGKKKTADMEREKPRFVAGAVERGVNESVATKLFETMILFAEYCFNKSHSTAYAYLTYQTAYLKANHAVEYSAALLRANSSQSDKLVRYLADANACGVRVLPPSVNRSELGFSVDRLRDKHGVEQSVVLFGLEAIKSVGDSVGRALIGEREARGPFRSIIDVIERLDSRVLNKRSMGALVMCGAFDELHPNRKVLQEQLETLLTLHRKVRDRRKRREKKTMTPEQEQAAIARDAADWEGVQLTLRLESETGADFPMLAKLAAEKATLGFYASGHPLLELSGAVARVLGSTPVRAIVGEAPAADAGAAQTDADDEFRGSVGVASDAAVSGGVTLADGAEVLCLSLVTDLARVVTARGQKMAKWSMEDTTARVSAVVFPSAYALCEASVEGEAEGGGGAKVEEEKEPVVSDDARVVVWGKVDRQSSGTAQVIVDDVQRVEDVTLVLATVPYRGERSDRAPRSAMPAIVRRAARAVQNPSQAYEPDVGGEYREYTNSDGVPVRARRRAKKTNLATKARIPLIVKMVGPDGSPPAYSYAGHEFRFQTVTDDDLRRLADETECKFEVVRVADVMRDGEVVPTDSEQPAAPGRNICDAPSALPATAGVAAAAEASAEEPVRAEGEWSVPRPALVPAVVESLADEPHADARAQVKGTAVAVGLDGPGASDAEWAQRHSVLRERTGAPQTSSLVRRLAAKRQQLASAQAASATTLVAVAEERSVSVAPAATMNVATDVPLHPPSTAVTEAAAPPEAAVAAGTAGATESASPSRPPPVAPPSWEDGGARDGDQAAMDTADRRLRTSDEALRRLVRSLQPDQKNLYDEWMSTLDGDILGAAAPSATGLEGDQRAGEQRSVVADDPAVPRVDARVSGEASREREESEGTGSDAPGVKRDCAPAMRKHVKSSAAMTGIDLGAVGLGGLLDAVSCVAADAVSRYTGAESELWSMDRLELAGMTTVLEGGVDVAGLVAAVDAEDSDGGAQGCVHVIVRVRESAPTGGRKRIRMLGSSVVTCHPSPGGGAVCPLEPRTIQARKDAASLRARLAEHQDRVAGAVADSSSDGRECEFVAPSALSDLVPEDALGDGGAVLLWMSLAAERAAAQLVGEGRLKFAAVALSSFQSHGRAARMLSSPSGRIVAKVVLLTYDFATVEVTLWEGGNGEERGAVLARGTFRAAGLVEASALG